MRISVFKYFLLILLEIFSTVVGQRSRILDIKPQLRHKNEIAYLKCTVVNHFKGSMVLWSKAATETSSAFLISKNEEIIIQGNGHSGSKGNPQLLKYEVMTRKNGNRKTYTLVIRRLAEEDAGKYTCTVRLSSMPYTTWPTKEGLLTVKVTPRTKHTVYEKEINSNLTLNCESNGNSGLNVTWRREHSEKLPGAGYESRGPLLHITSIKKQDRGKYICTSDYNGKSKAILKVDLLVLSKPSTTAVQNIVWQAQNRRFNAKLECIISGYPIPSMRWEVNTNWGWKFVQDEDKYDISTQKSCIFPNGDALYTLLIKSVQANDYTNYRCFGSNRYGESNGEIRLIESLECPGTNRSSTGS